MITKGCGDQPLTKTAVSEGPGDGPLTKTVISKGLQGRQLYTMVS